MNRKQVVVSVAVLYVIAWLFTMQLSPDRLARDVERKHEPIYRGWARISNVDVSMLFSPAPFIQRVEWTLHWKSEDSLKGHGEVCCRAWAVCAPGFVWTISEEVLWATK